MGKASWVALCLSVLFIAVMLRVSHLGDADYGLDEIFHVYVAQELINGDPPILPSGFHYERGLPYSYLVAIAGSVGGFNETALRMPSVLFGVLVIALVYGFTARWYSAFAGLIAAFITTFSPIEVALSREVRMYTMLQFLFLLIAFLFYEGFETSSSQHHPHPGRALLKTWFVPYEVRPIFLLWAGLLFLLAWRVHALIQPAMSGIIAYMLVMAGMAVVMKGLPRPLRQKYMVSGLAVLLGGIVGSVLFPEKVAKLLAESHSIPLFYEERAYNWNYFRWELLDEYPIIFGTLTFSFLVCIVKQPKLGLFLGVVFVVPFLLHSLVFTFKTYRYIFHLLPLMYIAAAVGISACLSSVWSAGCRLNAKASVPSNLWTVIVAGTLGAAMMGMLINMPWFMRTVKDYSTDFQLPHFADVQHHHWKKAMAYIIQHQKEGDVIISASAIHTKYYGASQPLYAMNDVRLRLNMYRNLQDEYGNLIDYASGAVVLKDLEDVKRVLREHHSGWFMTYLWRRERFWNHPDRLIPVTGTFPDEVFRYLDGNLERKTIPGVPDIAVWRWSREEK
ncbi:MAG: glycosyltransferase family 39 protein [Nitrospirales bacterium]|nr:glycosyltransferase family 39 protein [Nitrospira sp.]MDR4501914.1 glycosyltransferase family 39 protein [Nitrospirales bacterium]